MSDRAGCYETWLRAPVAAQVTRKATIWRGCLFLVIVWASADGLVGCVSVSVTGQSSGDMKQQVTDSLFYKSASLFYPNDAIDDPRQIPQLSPQAVRAFEHDFADQLTTVLRVHAADHDAIAQGFGEEAARMPNAKLFIVNEGAPEAQTAPDGEITLDLRVIHAALQAAVLIVYRTEVDLERIRTNSPLVSPGEYTLAEEKLATDVFLSKRARIDKTPGRSAIGDLRHSNASAPQKAGDELDWFGLSAAMRELNRVAVRYDAEILFLLAHEVGHIVLGHFGPHPVVVEGKDDKITDECSARRAKERAADVYAAFLITRATAGQADADMLGMLGEGVGRVPIFEGFDTFFNYTYDYAGFTTAGAAASCNYPPPNERLATVEQLYKAVRDGQIEGALRNAEQER